MLAVWSFPLTLLVSHICCVGSRKVLNSGFSAFISSHNADYVRFRPLRRPSWAGVASRRALDTRKDARSFQVGALQETLVSLLDGSSRFLYETLSQGSHATVSECLLASSAYMLPLMDSVENFGEFAKPYLPEFGQDVLIGIHQLSQFYSSVPFLSYTMSTLIYSNLVKKEKFDISYFLRYHFLQSLILSSFQNSLAMFYFKLLPFDVFSEDFVSVVSMMSAVITSFGAVFYCVCNALFGRFGGLPIISDAVQLHIGKTPSNTLLKKRSPEE